MSSLHRLRYALLLVILSVSLFSRVASQSGGTPMGEGMSFMPYAGQWWGSDASYSLRLAPNRWLWLFDDTLTGVNRTTNVTFFHNTIGISVCRDDSMQECNITYHWGTSPTTQQKQEIWTTGLEGNPGDDEFYWALDAFIEADVLYVFLQRTKRVSQGLGFQASGGAVVAVDNYLEHPDNWHKVYTNITLGEVLIPGQAAIARVGPGGNPYPPDPNGADYFYSVIAVTPNNTSGFQSLGRFPLSELHNMSQLTGKWQYYTTGNTFTQWVPDPSYAIVPKDMAVFWKNEIGTVRYHVASNQWINVCPAADAFFGGGAAYSIAPTLTGPWSELRDLYTIPETNPKSIYYNKDAWCYAEFQHPEYERNSNELAFTYVTQHTQCTHNTEDTHNTDCYCVGCVCVIL